MIFLRSSRIVFAAGFVLLGGCVRQDTEILSRIGRKVLDGTLATFYLIAWCQRIR